MTTTPITTAQPVPVAWVAFAGDRRISTGEPRRVATDVKRAMPVDAAHTDALIFDERTGRQMDLDTSGSLGDVLARMATTTTAPAPAAKAEATTATAATPTVARTRGRPKLGVVGREVSLLPRHWAWLEGQRGGSSATLRRLVEAARSQDVDRDRWQQAIEATGRFMWVMAGNRPGFEEASRALYAGDRPGLSKQIAHWPTDIRLQLEHMLDLGLTADATP
jgi:hypothetical protein